MFRQIPFHRIAILLLAGAALLQPSSGWGQTSDNSVPSSGNVAAPFAGKYEARVGSSYEPSHKKLRLDIGTSIDLLHWGGGDDRPRGDEDHSDPLVPSIPTSRFSLGTDFFTWTRLRSTGTFKFPVEAVDYYFGINGAVSMESGPISDLRLRIAHISAHLVDGDPSFTSPVQQYMTYSREFADLMVGIGTTSMRWRARHRDVVVRPYVGAMWLFHTIPDTLGRITPYAGVDGFWQPMPATPLSLKFGYEARLNTELAPIGEHLLRLGVKFGAPAERANGVLIEGSYYAGHSPYGQHFSEREHFWSLGFAVDF